MNKPAFLSVAVFALACSDPASGVTSAEVAPAVETPPVAPPVAARETLTIDTSASTLGFTGAKITASHDGSFSEFSGTVQLDPADFTQSTVDVTAQIRSLHIEPERLANHLLTADFFDPDQFPTARLVSTAIVAGGTGTVGTQTPTHTVTANLTLHGQTRSVTFPIVAQVTADALTAQAEFSINRQDFGIVYPGMPDDLIRDQVVIRFNIRAPRPRA